MEQKLKQLTHTKMSNNIIQTLRNDQEYYSGIGKNYLSNSDIGTLLSNPSQFGVAKDKTPAMLQGSYFHASILEPEKVKDYIAVDASTRSTNLYKDALKEHGTDMLLLQKEVDDCERMAQTILSNITFYDMIRDMLNRYEEPAIGEIGGVQWKGKADIDSDSYSLVMDLKSTGNLDEFKYSARKYNYDSQAYIYNQLFGKPMVFIVVEKETCRTGLFECSDEFLDRGREKVYRAIEVYNKFFGPSATDDITQYFTIQTL
jgi:hypothetical protein